MELGMVIGARIMGMASGKKQTLEKEYGIGNGDWCKW